MYHFIHTVILYLLGWLFCYEETNRNPRQCLGCQCELFVVCVYVFCLIYGHRLPCCPLCYLLPCRNYAGPSKELLTNIPPHTSFLVWLMQKFFWWTWGDSHPRPEHFSLCFIQQYYLFQYTTKYILKYLLLFSIPPVKCLRLNHFK